jgi:hypothetical protein
LVLVNLHEVSLEDRMNLVPRSGAQAPGKGCKVQP